MRFGEDGEASISWHPTVTRVKHVKTSSVIPRSSLSTELPCEVSEGFLMEVPIHSHRFPRSESALVRYVFWSLCLLMETAGVPTAWFRRLAVSKLIASLRFKIGKGMKRLEKIHSGSLCRFRQCLS